MVLDDSPTKAAAAAVDFTQMVWHSINAPDCNDWHVNPMHGGRQWRRPGPGQHSGLEIAMRCGPPSDPPCVSMRPGHHRHGSASRPAERRPATTRATSVSIRSGVCGCVRHSISACADGRWQSEPDVARYAKAASALAEVSQLCDSCTRPLSIRFNGVGPLQ